MFAYDGRSGAADLAPLLAVLAAELDEHIADEEATTFPVIRTYVSHRDMEKCERKFQQKASLPHLLFLLPWIDAQWRDLVQMGQIRCRPPITLRQWAQEVVLSGQPTTTKEICS